MKLRIVHVSEFCPGVSVGGTERYLGDLCNELVLLGAQCEILWVGSQNATKVKYADSIDVVPLNVRGSRFCDLDNVGVDKAARTYLIDSRPDIIHFHTCGLTEFVIAQCAHEREIPFVFTYHCPGLTCRRIDLLRWGGKVCDGEVLAWRCSACMIQQRLRCPKLLAWAVAGWLAPLGLIGRFCIGRLHRWTSFWEDTARFRKRLRMFLSHANKVIACAEWSIPVLEANGVSKDRIVHCPQGVGGEFVKASAVTKGRGQEAGRRIQRSGNQRLFTVGYVGRVTPVKGVHLLVEAFAKTRHPHARLRIFGCGTTESEAPYQKRLKKLAGADARIAFIAKVPFDKMLDQYREMDLLAIPSIWLETGPLTLFEALAMGVPAWGSARIGQMDLLKKYGRVIEPNTAEVWRIALEEAFAQHRDSTWKKIEQPPRGRSMADVAEEMMRLYALPVKQ